MLWIGKRMFVLGYPLWTLAKINAPGTFRLEVRIVPDACLSLFFPPLRTLYLEKSCTTAFTGEKIETRCRKVIGLPYRIADVYGP